MRSWRDEDVSNDPVNDRNRILFNAFVLLSPINGPAWRVYGWHVYSMRMPAQSHTNHLRIYVVTRRGQIGPVVVGDLQDLIADGTIDRHDQVRSGFGARLGSVDEIVTGKVKIGSDAMARRDDSRTDRHSMRRKAQSLGGMASMLACIAALAVSLGMWGWWSWDRAQSQQVTPPRNESNFKVRLSAAEAAIRGPATVHIAISPRSEQAQTIKLVLSGDQASMVPANGLVQIAPGQTGADVMVVRRGCFALHERTGTDRRYHEGHDDIWEMGVDLA